MGVHTWCFTTTGWLAVWVAATTTRGQHLKPTFTIMHVHFSQENWFWEWEKTHFLHRFEIIMTTVQVSWTYKKQGLFPEVKHLKIYKIAVFFGDLIINQNKQASYQKSQKTEQWNVTTWWDQCINSFFSLEDLKSCFWWRWRETFWCQLDEKKDIFSAKWQL